MSLSECICCRVIKETGLKQKNNSVLSYIYLNFYSTDPSKQQEKSIMQELVVPPPLHFLLLLATSVGSKDW